MVVEKTNRSSTKPVPTLVPAPGRGRYDRAQSKEDRQEEQVVRLLDATMEVMVREGYAGTTVSKICEHAGMSRATFYGHFSGIRPALLALHDRVGHTVYDHIEAHSTGIDDPFERLKAGVVSFMEIVSSNPAEARVIFREIRSAGPTYETHREEQLERYVERLMSDAAQAHKDGYLTRPPDENVIYSLVAGMEAVAMRYVLKGKAHQAHESVAALVELVIRALV